MSRLTVVLFLVSVVTISAECLAETLEDSESPLSRRSEADHSETDQDDGDRSASPQGNPADRFRPYQAQIRLVQCYACTGCEKVLANTTSKLCPYTYDPTKNNKCVVYTEKYSHMEKPLYIRGCASERGSCSEIKRAHENANARLVKMLYCSECDGDKCNTNGVSRSLPNITAAILFVIIIPLVGKYALS